MTLKASYLNAMKALMGGAGALGLMAGLSGCGPDGAQSFSGSATDPLPPQSYCATALENSAGFAGGEGSLSAPFLICTPAQLQRVATSDLSANYRLMTDLDLSGIAWVPIGKAFAYFGESFSGTLDGNGRTIRGLRVDRSSEDGVGLFGSVLGGSIHDLTVEGEVRGARYVGGVVGIHGNGNLGGASLSRVVFRGKVSGTGPIGGLLGGADGSVLEKCGAEAQVEGTGPEAAGGLIGYVPDGGGVTIRDSYAAAQVSGPLTGGILGDRNDAGGAVVIERAFFYGSGGGSGAIRGGSDGTVSANSVFYLADLNTPSDPVAGVLGLTAAQFQEATSFAAWDFQSVWRLEPGMSWPRLR